MEIKASIPSVNRTGAPNNLNTDLAGEGTPTAALKSGPAAKVSISPQAMKLAERSVIASVDSKSFPVSERNAPVSDNTAQATENTAEINASETIPVKASGNENFPTGEW